MKLYTTLWTIARAMGISSYRAKGMVWDKIIKVTSINKIWNERVVGYMNMDDVILFVIERLRGYNKDRIDGSKVDKLMDK